MATAIEGVGLHKTFIQRRSLNRMLREPLARAPRVEALRGVDLHIRRGEIFGLLGPNGAGKTTLLKILACLVLPDQGSVRIEGDDTRDEYRVKRRIGLVHSDERSFYWRLSARQNLRFFACLYDVPRRRVETRIDELLQRVDMLDAADRPFSDYSSGMKQRVAVARALLHDPPILLMDEPTRSLDPVASLALRAFLLDELKRRDGKTMLIASHNLREIEALADRVAVLVRGRVRQVGTVSEVKRWGVQERRFQLELQPGSATLRGPFRTIEDSTRDGLRRVVVSLEPGSELDDLLRSLWQDGVRVTACDRIEPDLEQALSKILAADEDPA